MNHPANGMEQQGPGSDRFHVLIRACQSCKDVPPVVNQGDQSGDDATAFDILSHVAAPAPLILDFIKDVFAIRPLPVQLGECDDRFVIVGNHYAEPVIMLSHEKLAA
jgi:hypothetical protein